MPTLAEIDRGALNELDKPYCRWVLPGQPVVLAPMEWIAKDYRGAPKSNLLRDRVQICTTTWSHQCGEAIYNRSTGDWRCVKHGARCCPPGAINCAGLPTCQPTTADQHFVYIDDPSLGIAKQKADASGNPIWTKAEPLPAPPPITDWGTILMWFGGGIVAFLLFTRR